MKTYLVKRLLLMIPTLIGITIVSFGVIHLAPGNPAEMKVKMSENAAQKSPLTKEMIEQTIKLYGLDKPLHVQYWIWVKRLATFDFGDSFKDSRPVAAKIKEALPITITLNVISVTIIYIIAVPLGVLSALKRKTFFDNAATVVLFALYSLPEFFVALMLITLFAGGDFLDWFPAYGVHSEGIAAYTLVWFQDFAWHLVLPVACMTYGGFAFLSRMERVGMLDVIRQDYIRTARAKGLPEKVVIMKHAFRNSLIPILTMLAGLLPGLLGGSLIIENIFSIRGMGMLAFEAIMSRDYPMIMGTLTISATLTLIGLLLSDVMYAIVDPRIGFSGAEGE